MIVVCIKNIIALPNGALSRLPLTIGNSYDVLGIKPNGGLYLVVDDSVLCKNQLQIGMWHRFDCFVDLSEHRIKQLDLLLI